MDALLILATWTVVVSVLAGLLGYQWGNHIDRVMPEVEFLPHDGRSRWEATKTRLWRAKTRAGIIVVGIAAIVGAVAGVIAL